MIGAAPASSSPDLGRYQIFATLGRGGMADVFLAVARGPRGFNKLVVLKRLRPHLVEEVEFREMFLDEARLAARLNHPNVVQSYEVGEGDGSFFIAMEYLDGQPLNRVLEELRKRGETLDPVLAARIVADACSGLAHAHELRDYDGTPLKIIHRDVSPHNVFVTYLGLIKLVDFGIAKAVVSRAETEIGVLKGKVAYMAPEQALGASIDHRADLFAMGIVLWESLAGRQLFAGENAANTLHRLMNEEIPKLSAVVPAVDPPLEAIVARALEKDPALRFQNARELRDALEGWITSTGKSVRAEDAGALVATMFADMRAQVQAEIKKHMAELSGPISDVHMMSLATIDQMERSGGNPSAQLANLSVDGTVQGSGLSRRTGSTLVDQKVAKQRRERAVLLIFIVLALFAAMAVLLFVRRPRPAPAPAATADTATAVPPPSAAPVATVPPTATAPVAPSVTAVATAPAAPPAAPARGHAAPPRAQAHAPRPAPAPSQPPSATVTTDANPGFLTLDTYPWSRVTEGGKTLGTTPLIHVALSPGVHALVLENPDQGIHQSYSVTIKSGESVTRSLGLK